MRTVRSLTLIPLFCAALLAGGLAVPAAADIVPDPLPVTVSPSTNLAGGDAVTVDASGLPPGADVLLTQCDLFFNDPDYDCFGGVSATVGTDGHLTTTVTLADPVWRSEPFGDPTPVYCRADVCRIFLLWSDEAGEPHVAQSDPLEFTGAPATISASPSDNLRKKQRVRVTGTAYGAEGRTVVVVEEACFAIVQASGCYGTIVKGTTTVAPDGTYALRVRASRYLADGTDCADPDILGYPCQLTARILDATGQPDDSFGVSRIGDPGALLTFRS